MVFEKSQSVLTVLYIPFSRYSWGLELWPLQQSLRHFLSHFYFETNEKHLGFIGAYDHFPTIALERKPQSPSWNKMFPTGEIFPVKSRFVLYGLSRWLIIFHWGSFIWIFLCLVPYLLRAEDIYICVLCLVASLRPTLWDPLDCSPPGSSVHGDSPGKNTGVGCHALLQGIFPAQGSNPYLPHCRQIFHCLSHQGSIYLLIYIYIH